MNRIFTVLFLAVPFLIHAQPVLLSNELLPIGSTAQYLQISDLAAIDTTVQGVGATWNFAGLQDNGQQIQWEFKAPADTPYGASYPTANYVRFSTYDNYYDYYQRTEQYLDLVGFVGPFSGVVTYSDPQRELVFPLTLGTTNQDTWANNLSSTDGTYDIACIGSGTLILPSGTYSEALMLRIILTEFFPVPVYSWISSTNGAQLLNYIDGDGLFYPDIAWYLTEVSVGVREHALLSDIRYYNPVTDRLLLSINGFNGVIDIAMTNAAGMVIDTRSMIANEEPIDLPVVHLSSGVYLVTLRPGDGSMVARTLRFVKE